MSKADDREVECYPSRVVLSVEQRAWVEADDRLRARAAALATRYGRDADDLYRTLKHLARTPGERLGIGLRHARLHPERRRENPSP